MPLLSATASRKQAKQAMSLSLQILKCMGDYPSKRGWREHAVAIIQEGIDSEDMRDELFCQVIKQLINNQRRYILGRTLPGARGGGAAWTGGGAVTRRLCCYFDPTPVL